MCHGRITGNLARFAARSFPDHFLRLVTDISAPPENHDLLHAANAPLLPGAERYYHLDGSRDDSREIAFLAGDGRRSHLLGIPLGLADPETQHDIVSVSLLRRRIWLNGGRGEGQDDDFRFVVDGRGTWIVRLRTGDTPPDSGACSPIDEQEEEDEDAGEGESECTDLLDMPDVQPWDSQSSQFGALQLTARQRRNQRVANTRLSDISTRLNVLHGIPHASTRLPSRFLRTLSDIQNLANEFRGLPRHLISERTFAMFDRVLDQLERTASLETITDQRSGASEEDTQPAHELDPAEVLPDSTLSPQDQPIAPLQSPRPTSPPLTISLSRHPSPRLQRTRLRSVISSLETMLASPTLPPRQTFSSVRRAFDEISTSLEATDDEPPDAEILDLIGTAQSLFWMLAQRAFPGPHSAGIPAVGSTSTTAMGRGRSRLRSRPAPAARPPRRHRAGRRRRVLTTKMEPES